MTKTPVRLSDLFRYYKQLPHQMAAIVELEAVLLKVAPDAFNKQAALLSWLYNVGGGAVEESTLRRRINAGESAQVVIPQELPKWDKANGKPLAGLTRRRAAEVTLFTRQAKVST